MVKILRTLIIEDDPFAREWMTFLLARDLRTHVVGDVGTPEELNKLLNLDFLNIDLIILDTDMPSDYLWLKRVFDIIDSHNSNTSMLLIGTCLNQDVLSYLSSPIIKGYILKNEIGLSFAWAIEAAFHNNWVLTPGIFDWQGASGFSIPKSYCLLDGRSSIWPFTPNELRAARYAFVFSMERFELADELQIQENSTYVKISELYKKMPVDELLTGLAKPNDCFGENTMLVKRFEDLLTEDDSPAKRRKETIAFHLLTIPKIIDNY